MDLFANLAYTQNTQPELSKHLHKVSFSLVPSTWIKSNGVGFYATCLGLPFNLVGKHLPQIKVTTPGHMRETKQGLRSTSKQLPLETTPVPNNTKTHIVAFK